MAVERDFELLDDYLAGRLKDNERLAFEEKLRTDPDLKNECELQQQLVTGLKKARVAELKAIMNNVPIPSVHGGETTIATKIALWTVVVGVVVTGVYLYMNNEQEVKAIQETETQQSIKEAPVSEPEAVQADDEKKSHENPPVVSGQAASSEQKPSHSPKTTKDKKTEENKSNEPSINVFDPTKEKQDDLSTDQENQLSPRISQNTSMTVEIDSQNKKYDFHYQFKDGKLLLYGPFENNLYEIMEFFSEDKRTMFLYYQDNFYLLKDGNEKLKPLGIIQDPALIKKLKDHRRN